MIFRGVWGQIHGIAISLIDAGLAPIWWLSSRHSLRLMAVRSLKKAARGNAPLIQRKRPLPINTNSIRVGAAGVAVANGTVVALALSNLKPPLLPLDGLMALWQVQATIIGLALALTVFVMESGGLTARLRRDLTPSTRVYQAATLGILLVILTGEAVVFAGSGFGGWLETLVWIASLIWAVLVLAAIREILEITDPVNRVSRRREHLLKQTDDSLRGELVRNVAASILTSAMGEAGGASFPFGSPDRRLGESARVRSPSKGQLTDINLPRLIAAARVESHDAARLTTSVRLDAIVDRDTLIAESTRTIPIASVRTIGRAVRIRVPRAAVDITAGIEALRFEAQSSIGPDTTVLEAVSQAFESILERYALGWTQYVQALDAEHISGFRSSSGAPLASIESALYQLTDAAVHASAADAVFHLAYFPIQILSRAVNWQAPAYFRLLALYPALYRFLGTADAALYGRVGERPWLHLVEALEFILPIRQPPYVAESPGEIIDQARRAIRSSISGVLRIAVQRGDNATVDEALRRWRIAEGDRTSHGQVPDELRYVAPLAWEVTRQALAGSIGNARALLELCSVDKSINTLIAGLEAHADPDRRLADLDDWAIWSMKSHEVGWVNADTDLMKAFLLSAAIHTDPSATLAPLRITKTLHDLNDHFAHALADLKANLPKVEALFSVTDLDARLKQVDGAWAAGVTEFERTVRDAIRATPVDSIQVAAFEESVREAWGSGFPQTWFRSASVIRPPTSETRSLATHAWADKRIFQVSDYLPDSAAEIGTWTARPLLDGELAYLREMIGTLRGRTFGVKGNTERIRAAMADLRKEPCAGGALLLPGRWELLSSLEADGSFLRERTVTDDALLGKFENWPVYDLGDNDLGWATAICAATGLTVSQAASPDVSVQGIDATLAKRLAADGHDVGGDISETSEERLQLHVRLQASIAIGIRVRPRGVRRILLT